ncbi:MAG: 30S ribosomal protein S14 [Rhodospirillales bacterium]|nr:30S ribosomal protein S14 [Rhodospirillales bacterium]
MAKKSAVEKNKHRRKLVKICERRRHRLMKVARDREASPEDRFQAYLKLAELPRNGSKVRIRNRCVVSGRPRGYYRKFALSRITLRELASQGLIPGVTKSSW